MPRTVAEHCVVCHFKVDVARDCGLVNKFISKSQLLFSPFKRRPLKSCVSMLQTDRYAWASRPRIYQIASRSSRAYEKFGVLFNLTIRHTLAPQGCDCGLPVRVRRDLTPAIGIRKAGLISDPHTEPPRGVREG